MNNFQEKVSFIWSVADLLRGDYKQSEYGRVILPLTVLRRLDCVLEPTKESVLAKVKSLPTKADEAMRDLMLCQAVGKGMTFYNTSKFVLQPTDVAKGKKFSSLLSDQDQLAANLTNYIAGFSETAREIFLDKFKFGEQINRLDEANLLYLVVSKFTEIDLHPDVVDNIEMGYVFEELIRRFSEASNETAGEHFTPREVIRLMVNLLFVEDSDALTKKGVIRTLYDPACGTGGMLSVAENYLRELNPSSTLKTYGQELNPESYAICKSDMLIKGEDASNVKFGNSFTQDGLPGERYDYFLSNPPFGVEWKKVQKEIKDEHENLGMAGRFGPGLPRVSDGSLLFLMHMMSKFRHDGTGSRLAIVFNGSPLFTGSAGSGESEIRRWIIENDRLEAIVGLPDQLFYNTGISTYVWVVTSKKPKHRKGKVQLIDASGDGFFVKMRKSLGNKRKEIGDGENGKPDQIAAITQLFGDFAENERSKIFDNEDFGYWRITVEHPLRLNFVVDDERLGRLRESKPFQNLASSRKKGAVGKKEIEEGQQCQRDILSALEDLHGGLVVKNRDHFTKKLKSVFKDHELKIAPALLKGILGVLSERDEEADICTDSKGNPEPDSDLRDYENVPLKEEIQVYFEREVLPHVPDAWIDESKTKKGYDIPFTRHFYQYTPLRPLDEIEGEIVELEDEIQGMLKEVLE
ncbi:putative type I restriction enzymeP M protein [Symmachiella dynata]|uniref:type I restriction-modification system subunit M n=1 Tax=Symmachiella dynata TaxID=2527995 RepID=UPI00118816BD|nr:putative type I restriction enzymeP M protein [Symmachiella dynata]